MREWTQYEATRESLSGQKFSGAIYFADNIVNMYQIQQWYEPMRRLAEKHPIMVITRDVVTANALRKECPLPVAYFQLEAEIEQWINSHRIGAVFYVNQNMRNFQMLGQRDPAHIFICHGESDKDYMASNQLKAYDYTFVAGDAAIERIKKRLVDFDTTKRLIPIGRPQTDVSYKAPSLPSDERLMVLYAPTWEGDRASMHYSSLMSHALPMLSALTATGKHRIIYRPHPRTGIFDNAYKEGDQAIRKLLADVNSSDPSAKHLTDIDTSFGWQLASAALCICDVSAVAYDWLATGKPLIVTHPESERAAIDESGIFSCLPTVKAEEASDILEFMESEATTKNTQKLEELVHHYFGDTSPGASMDRFIQAAGEAISLRSSIVNHYKAPVR
jgi:hypothetical protein